MLKLICGIKGTGKTKDLIERVNTAAKETKGCVVCIEKGAKLIHEIDNNVRLVDTDEYNVDGAKSLYGMIAGAYASNYDITHIFIDSALKICRDEIDDFAFFMDKCADFAGKHGLEVTVTASIEKEKLPQSVIKYL